MKLLRSMVSPLLGSLAGCALAASPISQPAAAAVPTSTPAAASASVASDSGVSALEVSASEPAASVAAPASVQKTVGMMPVSQVIEVPVEKNAPRIEGHPLTSVVVTQCNLIVAVYMTMPDGRLLRFDHTTSLHPDQLMTMAYSATRSERVEVSCNDSGVAGFEKHEPV